MPTRRTIRRVSSGLKPFIARTKKTRVKDIQPVKRAQAMAIKRKSETEKDVDKIK